MWTPARLLHCHRFRLCHRYHSGRRNETFQKSAALVKQKPTTRPANYYEDTQEKDYQSIETAQPSAGASGIDANKKGFR